MRKPAANKIKVMLIGFYEKRNLPFSKNEYRKAKRMYNSLNWKLKDSFKIV